MTFKGIKEFDRHIRGEGYQCIYQSEQGMELRNFVLSVWSVEMSMVTSSAPTQEKCQV